MVISFSSSNSSASGSSGSRIACERGGHVTSNGLSRHRVATAEVARISRSDTANSLADWIGFAKAIPDSGQVGRRGSGRGSGRGGLRAAVGVGMVGIARTLLRPEDAMDGIEQRREREGFGKE